MFTFAILKTLITMKNFLSFVFLFCFLFSNAQLDKEHWYAPMSAASLQGTPEAYLYLSTNETTPFTVEIYNNNTLFTVRQISKGNPAEVTIPFHMMIASSSTNLFTENSMGLHAKANKKFFSNFRFGVLNHAEIVTSKGLAGLGTTFYVGCVPNTNNPYYVNSTIGVIATEDNTTVTLSGYNPGVIFTDGISAPTRTFTINKGKSYIIDANAALSTINMNGLTGAKIVSDKPISVTNGNFTSIYTNFNSSNTDIVMDQAVPVDRLGNNFVLAKGNGLANSGMEAALVIATEPNTTITVNGNLIPGVTLNPGQYYIVEGNNYINQGNDNYNMSLSTSKNAYVYQLLGGTSTGSIYATGGMNFIPPLSCFLPSAVDEIGFINKIGSTNYNTKLNIITQTGATVTLNGAGIAAANGPYPVTGNANWVTYSIPNVTGNVTVNSTKPVTAGISAGNGAVGYGGYFAGFSSVPVIMKTGDCYSGVLLEVDNTYDTYQWSLNGVAIPGATTHVINPELYGPGNYTCTVTKINCESKTTEIYVYTLCPPITTTTFNIGSCNSLTITPSFTNSTQVIVPSQTSIIAQPINGTATVNPTTGQITYTPNAGLAANATDTFVYYVSGNGNPAAFEYFRVNININVLQVNNASLTACSGANGNGVFDLSTANLSTDLGVTYAYFSDAALTNPIINTTAYSSGNAVVYVKVTSQYGCVKVVQIQLVVNPSPAVDTQNFNATLCDDNFDGAVDVNFNNVSTQIVNNANNFTIRYYLSQVDATAGNNNNLPNNWAYTVNTTVYVRVDTNSGLCPSAFGQIDFKVGNKLTLLTNSVAVDICDALLDGSESVDLNTYKNLFSADPSVVATFFSTLQNAQNNTGALTNVQIITGVHTFYVRLVGNTGCPNIATLKITLKSAKKSDVLLDRVICSSERVLLDAGPGFVSYQWSTGATTSSILAGVGNYYVDLEFNGCFYRQHVKVTAAQLPEITKIDVENNKATVHVTGGTPPYQYSLNDIDYQTSNVFSDLPRGTHRVYVKDKNACQSVYKDFLIVNLINTITPNGDGHNDYLDYSDLKIKSNVSIEVVDRYGYAVYKSLPNVYRWDGKVNGSPLPTGTYWYILKWIEPDTKLPISYTHWLLIKNRD